jgi:Asp/Glu/hydantoin racemase
MTGVVPVRIGIIRVITSEDRTFLEAHARLLENYLGKTNVVFKTECIDGFSEGIHTHDDALRAIPSVVAVGKSLFTKSGVDSIIVSCADDPGVANLQQEVAIPVIGAGSAAASFAALLGKPVGVLGIEDGPPMVVSKILQKMIVAYRKPQSVKTTLDIAASTDEYIDEARHLVREDHARVILLACTGLSTARIAPVIEKMLKVTVVDPVIAAGTMAYYAARGNRT